MGSDICIPEYTSPNELHTDTIYMYGGAKQGRDSYTKCIGCKNYSATEPYFPDFISIF